MYGIVKACISVNVEFSAGKYGQNPVVHAPPGGTRTTARRPGSTAYLVDWHGFRVVGYLIRNSLYIYIYIYIYMSKMEDLDECGMLGIREG